MAMRVCSIKIADIKNDPDQPRRTIKKKSVEAMARSIHEVGLLQPVIVRKAKEGYILIAGERRYQASIRLGFEEVPAVIMGEGDYSIRQVQLVENVQREDLDPLERAIAINEYIKEEGLTKSAAAGKLGVPRTTLTDWLAILDVNEKYRALVVDNYNQGPSPLTVSHISIARGLAQKLNDPTLQDEILEASIKHNLNRMGVRALADYIRDFPGISAEDAMEKILQKEGKEKEAPRKSSGKKDPADTIEEIASDIGKSLKALEGILQDSKKLSTTDKKEEVLESLVRINDLITRALPRQFGIDVKEARKKLGKNYLKNVL